MKIYYNFKELVQDYIDYSGIKVCISKEYLIQYKHYLKKKILYLEKQVSKEKDFFGENSNRFYLSHTYQKYLDIKYDFSSSIISVSDLMLMEDY